MADITRPAPSCADLRRPSLDIALNTILLLAIVLSYLPQVHRIISRGSTFGIAANYVLFNYLFTAMQFTLVMLLSCWHYPIFRCIRDRELNGWDAYGASLGIILVTALWLGSGSLVVLFLRYPNTVDNLTTELVLPSSLRSRQPDRSQLIASLCTAHFLIWVLPTIWIASRLHSLSPWSVVPFVPIANFVCIPLLFVLVLSQFRSQIRELLAMEGNLDASSLSAWTLALQSITFILLGISWVYRMGPRGKGYNRVPKGTLDPYTWYYLAAWPYLNNMIFGIGQGLLFLVYLYQKRRTLPGSLKDGAFSASSERTGLLV